MLVSLLHDRAPKSAELKNKMVFLVSELCLLHQTFEKRIISHILNREAVSSSDFKTDVISKKLPCNAYLAGHICIYSNLDTKLPR